MVEEEEERQRKQRGDLWFERRSALLDLTAHLFGSAKPGTGEILSGFEEGCLEYLKVRENAV